MSPSKLESLPNEILIDTLEKYVNGVDILATLAHRLNCRFDALIAQCQQLRFNFIRCQKNKFRHCLEVFPAYYDKITELALSDKDAPGQIYDFLRLFPSFAPFKSLSTLNFCCCNDADKGDTIKNALLSLPSTRVETLSIKMSYSANFPLLNKLIFTLMNISTLKRLFLGFTNPSSSYWEFPTSTQSNIEYLTIASME